MAIVFLTKAIMSIGGVSYLVTTAILLGDYTNPRSRGKAFAMAGLMAGIGTFIAHLGLAQLPKYMKIESIFVYAGLITLIAMLISKVGLTEVKKSKGKKEKVNWREILLALKNSPGLRLCYAGAFVSKMDNAILAVFTMVWVLRAAKDFGMTFPQATAQGGITLAIFSITNILTKPFWGILVDRLGRVPSLVLSLAFGGLGYFLIGFGIEDPFSTSMKLSIALCGLGASGDGTASSTLTVDLAPKKNLGVIMGGYAMVNSIGMVIMIPLGGFFFDLLGYSSPFIIVGFADWIVMSFALIIWNKVPKTVNNVA